MLVAGGGEMTYSPAAVRCYVWRCGRRGCRTCLLLGCSRTTFNPAMRSLEAHLGGALGAWYALLQATPNAWSLAHALSSSNSSMGLDFQLNELHHDDVRATQQAAMLVDG
eukprot:360158-Chlamydomonas_euryale.AAC.4